jgi:hypothetical protein
MAIFNSYVKLPEGKTLMELHGTVIGENEKSVRTVVIPRDL